MKIALIGDVHANLPALEAVLEHAQARGVQAIYNIGDFVGYNAFPEEVVSLLRRREDVVSIIGNYDQKALQAEKKQKKWASKKDPRKAQAFLWAYQQLSKESREFLRKLPEQRNLFVEGWLVLLAHGSPAAVDEHLLPDTSEERLRELAAMTRAQIIVVGHSHQPFVRPVGEKVFINTGSVGRPDDGDPRASYAVLNMDEGQLTVTHHRLEYDSRLAAQAIRGQNLPEEFAQMVLLGRSLDWIENHWNEIQKKGSY